MVEVRHVEGAALVTISALANSTMESSPAVNAPVSTVRIDQPIDETLRQWNIARAALAASLRTYMNAFSQFELTCACFFDSKELDFARPDVRVALDDEVISLTTHGSSVTSTKKKLLRLKNMSMFISPIIRLPAEILVRVFTFAVDSYRNADPSHRGLSIKQVDAVSSVCSSWHCIALSTRRLWSYIDINKLHHINYVSLWLERAGSHPLDVVNAVSLEDPKFDQDRCSALSLIHSRITDNCLHSGQLSKANSVKWTRAEAELPLQSARPKRAALIYARGLDYVALQTPDSGLFDRSSRAQTIMSE
ncbi:hypothetical protein BDV93DRAFT_611863 [Ceratobasidium sp. AG-I]|nr:hypothetical protein BDV93DRAFT_611863 [Ceratobasidium sp. AG-I]